MMLRELLAQRQQALCARWLAAVLADYGVETAAMWQRERDPFANPVRHAYATAAPQLFEVVAGGGELAAVAGPLREILRIRLVQQFAPSRAVAVVLMLRDAVRSELAAELAGGLAPELEEVDRRVERILLLAFDIFVDLRGQIDQLRREELKRSVASLVRRWHVDLSEPPSECPAALAPGGGQ